MTSATTSAPPAAAPTRLPIAALIVMALTGFIVIMTETLPAGLLPQLAAGMGVTEGGAGQLVSAYAIGTTLAVIPAIAMTRGVRRKPLLIAGLIGFLVANTVTAFVPIFAVALVARFIAGAFAGLLWGMLATYARGISPHAQAGRALSIALTGTPVALALGTPLGSWIGTTLSWQFAFISMSVLTVVVLVLALALVPDLAGNASQQRTSIPRVLAIPGVATILVAVFAWMLAHNVLYTYIAPFLSARDLALRVDVALLVFGVASLAGIWLTGILIDRALRQIALGGTVAMVIAGLVLALAGSSTIVAVVALVLWGVAFGGAATQLQTAMGTAAGSNADMGIAVLTAVFNLAIFVAAAAGAIFVEGVGAAALPLAMAGVAVLAFIAVASGRKSAFPRS